ncbi:hypothetical protein ASE72_09100 [Sphingomonas sp. Leaf20]|nr:hypothetical protein ASE72_09100 [Sphingomonas sp. Leaf20]
MQLGHVFSLPLVGPGQGPGADMVCANSRSVRYRGGLDKGRLQPAILPRQGEVAPKASEGEERETDGPYTSPSVRLTPATSPRRGRIFWGQG